MNLPGEDRPIRWERRGGKLFCVIGEEPKLSDLSGYYALQNQAVYSSICPCCGRSSLAGNIGPGFGALGNMPLSEHFGGIFNALGAIDPR